MLLKEFDLDLRYMKDLNYLQGLVDSGMTMNEATRQEYNEKWKNKRLLFRRETRCITSMFERLFERFHTESCWKILIEIIDGDIDPKIYTAGGIYETQVPFSYDLFAQSDDRRKKEYSLSILMDGINIICKSNKWDIAPFIRTSELIIRQNYDNEWRWKKPIKSPSRDLSAQILCKHGVHHMDFFVEVKKKNNLLGEKHIISTAPHEFTFSNILGELKWISVNEVLLISKDKRQEFKIGLKDLTDIGIC